MTENAEFVACMEDIPEVYRRPYDPKRPVVCLDEQPVQLIQETRWPLPVEPGQPVRYDDEYERAGTAVNFMLTESLGGRRQVRVRATKTAIDLAQEVKTLLDIDDPDAEPVVQFEHPHPGLAVQSFSTRGSAGVCSTAWRFTTRQNMAVGWASPRSN